MTGCQLVEGGTHKFICGSDVEDNLCICLCMGGGPGGHGRKESGADAILVTL